MARPLPTTPERWLKEIRLAWRDAAEAKPFSDVAISDAELFHLAPVVCLKFRGRELTGDEADRVTEAALANYVVNTDLDSQVKGLTLVNSAVRNDLDVWAYLQDVLDQLLAGSTGYASLRPDVWKKSHPQAERTYRAYERRDAADHRRLRRARRRRPPSA